MFDYQEEEEEIKEYKKERKKERKERKIRREMREWMFGYGYVSLSNTNLKLSGWKYS